MHRLKIDLSELAMAFENDVSEFSYYLDLTTGRVVQVDEQMMEEEDFDDESSQDADNPEMASDPFEAAEPDWIKELKSEAREVEAGLGTRYIEVAQDDPHEAYRDMEAFIATVDDKRLQSQLSSAISGRGAFGRFKDVLGAHFHERERWFEFRDARVEERVRDWLESREIEPIVDPQEEEKKQQRKERDRRDVRNNLIAEVLIFVRAARALSGVQRIALIGSLTTDRADPKDADVVVTIADEMDLSELAKVARRLQGRAQGFNRGGDIFLVGPHGQHLGRTCPWRECRPGIRQSCNALHCGQRPYLHDDLQALTLPAKVVAAPAIELWPQVLARVTIPDDVKIGLLDPLETETR